MVWSYKRNRGEIQAKPTLPDRFTAQTLDEAYMSHEKSGPRNYIHEKLHEQIVEKLQAQLTQERERLDEAVALLAATKHKIICINAGRHRPKTSCKSCELASQIDDFLKGLGAG